jgi:hypothetical protein
MNPAQQVEQHAFTQCPARRLHRAELERSKDRAQDRNSARDHRLAIRPHSRQVESLDVLRGDELLAQPIESGRCDRSARHFAALAQNRSDRPYRSRRTERLGPTECQQPALHGPQFELRLDLGALTRFVGDLAVFEEPLRPRHAAHVETRQLADFEALADDDLGAAAADVDDEASPRHVRRMMRHSEVDEPSFLRSRDDFDRMPQRPLRTA